VQGGVPARAGDQFGWRAILRDAPVVEYEHSVGDLHVDSRRAMTTAVRSDRIMSNARRTSRAKRMSKEDVTSSRINTAGSARNVRPRGTGPAELDRPVEPAAHNGPGVGVVQAYPLG
jgi:hypothetical protein